LKVNIIKVKNLYQIIQGEMGGHDYGRMKITKFLTDKI
jgi:hypothetical protein